MSAKYDHELASMGGGLLILVACGAVFAESAWLRYPCQAFLVLHVAAISWMVAVEEWERFRLLPTGIVLFAVFIFWELKKLFGKTQHW